MKFFSKVVSSKITDDFSTDVSSCFRINFGSDAVFTQSLNFVNFGLMSINKTDTSGYVSVPMTKVRSPTNSSDCIRHRQDIEEVTADRVSETKSNKHYILKIILKL